MTTALVLIVISLAGAGLLLLTRRDGGFPAFNMDPVDFVALYRQ